jgi:hypothetical protein
MINAFLRRLKFRLLNNNPVVWYQKWLLAPKILQAPPQSIPEVADFEIHMVTCARDFECMLWAVRSFYFHSGSMAALTVHDDGTLTPWHAETLTRLFPGSRLISRAQSDREVGRYLARYPNCQAIRQRDLYMIKVFDLPYYTRAKRLILLDSDVLFFAKPVDLITPTAEAVFNSDIWTSYACSTEELKARFGITVAEKINIGVGAINRDCFDLDAVENLLADDKLRTAPYIVDQTIFAILASQKGVRLLGPEYTISLSRGLTNVISKHYTRLVRHLFFIEGLPRLVASGILS